MGGADGRPPARVSPVSEGKVASDREAARGAAGAMLPVMPGAVEAASVAFRAPDEPVIRQVQARSALRFRHF